VVNKIHLRGYEKLHATWTLCPSWVVQEQNQSTKVKDLFRHLDQISELTPAQEFITAPSNGDCGA
jgi:hypothetical protein